MQDTEKEMQDIKELMDEVIEDATVPKNIKKAVETAKEQIKKRETVGFSNAIYALDDISNDINIPTHTRTTIWEIISKLEEVKEKLKE